MAATFVMDEIVKRLGFLNRFVVWSSFTILTFSSNSHQGPEPVFASESFGRIWSSSWLFFFMEVLYAFFFRGDRCFPKKPGCLH